MYEIAEQVIEKVNTKELLEIENSFSEPLSNKLGERKIRTGITNLTPETAIKLLINNPNNRQAKEANINFLVKEILEGRWVLNGEAIIIDTDGNIVDGQHRLLACVKADKAIKTLIVFGVAPTVINTIDTGTKRMAKDCLHMNKIVNADLAASAIKLINQFERGTYSDVGATNRVLSNQQVVDFYNTNQKRLVESFNIGMSLYKKCNKLMGTSVIAGLHFLFAKKSVSQADEFFTKLCTGIALEVDSPITAVRNKLMREAVSKNSSLSQKDKVKNIIYAWNKYRNNEKCKTIKLSEDIKLTIQ